MKQVLVRLASASILAAVCVAISIQANGAETTRGLSSADREVTAAAREVSDEEMRDLTTLAKQEGIPVDEVIKRFAGSGAFTDAADAIDRALPGGYVAAVWGDGSGVVTVRPGEEETALRLLEDYGAVASVKTADALTGSESAVLAERAGASLPQGLGEVVLTHVDAISRTLTIEIVGPSKGEPGDPKDRRFAGAAQVAASAQLEMVLLVKEGSGGPEARGGWN